MQRTLENLIAPRAQILTFRYNVILIHNLPVIAAGRKLFYFLEMPCSHSCCVAVPASLSGGAMLNERRSGLRRGLGGQRLGRRWKHWSGHSLLQRKYY